MNEITVSRLGCIVLSLFPALWGLFSLLNNTADFAGTARNAVGPLLAMQDTYQTPGLMWRAISATGPACWGWLSSPRWKRWPAYSRPQAWC